MLNKTILEGRITANVEEVNLSNSDKTKVSFSLANNVRDSKGKDHANFQKCEAWGATAKFIQKHMGTKGSRMIAVGSIKTEQWEKDGKNQSMNVLVVNEVSFANDLGAKAVVKNTPAPVLVESAPSFVDEPPF